MKILSIELNRLTKLHPEFTAKLIDELFKQIPYIGKDHEKYYLVNVNLTIHNPQNLPIIWVFNTFVQGANISGYNLIQIIKN